jgi:4-hydroxymandelate oxidase
LLGVSTNAAVPFAHMAAAGAPWWFQVYVTRDRSLTELLVERAIRHGARALLLTVDMMALLPADVNPRNWPDGPDKARMTNLTAEERAAAGPDGTAMDFNVTFADIAWLRDLSGLPVLVKGVLRGDDARACMDAGAAGIVVSTHGGRRLGPSVSSARALPEVVEAVGDAGEVYVDSGLRNAEHVAAALAMGARAVFVGRPVLWALSARGQAGVSAALGELQTELRQVMLQLGAPTIADLTADLIAP